MENKTDTIKIFISCPTDVDKEAMIVCNKSIEYSKLLMSSPNKTQIIPFYWKRDTISDIGNKTQEVIYSQKNVIIGDCDIYIGIMWTIFGHIQENGLSPTQEEFENVLNRKMPRKFGAFSLYHLSITLLLISSFELSV